MQICNNIKDASEYKQIQANTSRYKQIQANTSKHKIIQANYAATDFYGYTNDEFLELSALDIRPKNHKEQYRTTIGKKLDDYGDIQVFSNITHQHKNGEHLLTVQQKQ